MVLKTAPPACLSACLEQTGHYGDAIAEALHDTGIAGLCLVNPQRIKAFGMQKLRRNKSDTADAKLIALFLKAEHADLRPWQPQSLAQQKITALSRCADSLTQAAARLKTTLEGCPDKTVSSALKRMILAHEKEIKALRLKIREIIAKSPELAARSELLTTIPGIGEVASQMILGEIPTPPSSRTPGSSPRGLASPPGTSSAAPPARPAHPSPRSDRPSSGAASSCPQ